LLGLDDQAASLLGSAHDGAASLTEATGWELANSLVLGGDFARASRYYRLLNVDAPPSAWAAGLRAWMLLEQGETNASHSYISEVERRQVEFRGIRTIVAWRWLSGLQASWVSAGGDVPPDA